MSSRNRVQQEQIRKRRNNLFRRHNDFWRLYAIRRWTTLMPNGRTYTYRSHPHLSAPIDREMVSSQRRRKNLMLTESAGTTPASHAQNTGGLWSSVSDRHAVAGSVLSKGAETPKSTMGFAIKTAAQGCAWTTVELMLVSLEFAHTVCL
ncbi:hypothetical protein BJX62DRAFT_245565 [Aspergillus germanicus]